MPLARKRIFKKSISVEGHKKRRRIPGGLEIHGGGF